MNFDYYTGTEMVEMLNTSVDDFLETEEALNCINFGIAKLNAYCKTAFPRLKDTTINELYEAIPDTFIDTIVIEWARWRFKHREEDINGAISFQNTMTQAMHNFYTDYVINGYADDFRITKDVYPMTFSNDLLEW